MFVFRKYIKDCVPNFKYFNEEKYYNQKNIFSKTHNTTLKVWDLDDNDSKQYLLVGSSGFEYP